MDKLIQKLKKINIVNIMYNDKMLFYYKDNFSIIYNNGNIVISINDNDNIILNNKSLHELYRLICIFNN